MYVAQGDQHGGPGNGGAVCVLSVDLGHVLVDGDAGVFEVLDQLPHRSQPSGVDPHRVGSG